MQNQGMDEQKMEEMQRKETMDKIKNKIVVMSGKGGVGKSTVATNIAYGLALEGKSVGLLDADLHGPNIPQMVGLEGQKLPTIEEPFMPHENLKVVSLSFYVESSDNPIIWRGPAKIGAIRQLLRDVKWGELDYLIVDLPPGTGDEPLTIAQDMGDITGSVIVTTPQDVALLDSRKSVKFSEKIGMPIMGIIENMSGFVCPHCNERIDIFKEGGGEKAAKELGVNFLGKIPLDKSIVDAGDSGKPFIYFNDGKNTAQNMKTIIEKVVEKSENSVNNDAEKIDEHLTKIAFPTNDGETVETHFGHCKKFKIFSLKGRDIVSDEEVEAPPHQPGLLPKFLGEHGVSTVITGGLGSKAVALFNEQEIETILGATGGITDNLNKFLDGKLESKGSACEH